MSTPPDASFGCPWCWPADADLAWVHRLGFATTAELVDESHYRVTIRACPRCGQPFVSVFTECVDWGDGDDPQAWVMLPLTADEAHALSRRGAHLTEGELERLDPRRRSLVHDAPKGGTETSSWTTGIAIRHHD